MNDRQLYLDFGKSIRDRLYNEINARIWFEVYPEVDTIVVKTCFKEFNYHYAINHVQEHVYSSDEEDVIADFLKQYKRDILRGFFKTNERKQRDKEERVFQGVYA